MKKRKKQKQAKRRNEEESKSEKKEEKKEKEKSSEIDPTQLSTSLLFTSINKYTFDTSNEKCIKLYLTDGFDGIKNFNSSNIKSKFTKIHLMYL